MLLIGLKQSVTLIFPFFGSLEVPWKPHETLVYKCCQFSHRQKFEAYEWLSSSQKATLMVSFLKWVIKSNGYPAFLPWLSFIKTFVDDMLNPDYPDFVYFLWMSKEMTFPSWLRMFPSVMRLLLMYPPSFSHTLPTAVFAILLDPANSTKFCFQKQKCC